MTDCVPSSSIRALLLIENRLMREALARLFRKRPDLIVVGQTSPADETPPGILKTQCNVLVGDAFLFSLAWRLAKSNSLLRSAPE